MEAFRRLEGQACALPIANIDTDQLIPARFMKRSRAEGYGPCLLYDLRHDPEGRARPDFPLNDPAAHGSTVIVARRNFGSGSSREAAVYALMDFGIRAVIAPSFGDIFAANAVNNGLLPAQVSEAEAEALLAALGGPDRRVAIDLETCCIAHAGRTIGFQIDPVWRTKLLNGWGDIDLTMSYAQAIAAFAEADGARRPWLVPHA